MGKKNTSKRGRKPKEEPECTYKTLSESEKLVYHRKKLREHRGTIPSTEVQPGPSTPKRPRGRPTIMGVTAMTPTTLRRRRSYLNLEKRKKSKRVEKAKVAVALRYESYVESDSDNNNSELEFAQVDLDNDPENSMVEELVIASPPPRTSNWRAKCKLRGILTGNIFDNMLLLLAFVNEHNVDEEIAKELKKLCSLKLDVRKHRYRLLRLENIFSKLRRDVEVEVIKFWLENILASPAVESLFNAVGIDIPIIFLPKSIVVSRKAAEIGKNFQNVSSQSSHDIRVNTIKYIIDVAKKCNLNQDDSRVLSTATNCSIRFAHRVLLSIENKTEDAILTLRKERIDSIHVTCWPRLINEFVLRPENSRAVPGEETVSIRYGVRKPKFLLLKSRDTIAKEFKNEYPDCKFNLSVIKREFPQNAITPSTRDNERNTCPVHANVRRAVKCINKAFGKHNLQLIPFSCRDLCKVYMCSKDGINSMDPLSWNTDCVEGTCEECPEISFNCPNEIFLKNVKFSQWESRKVKVTKTDKHNVTTTTEKYVFALYPYDTDLKGVIDKLIELIPGIKQHIYNSHSQWAAHDVHRSNLDPSSIITIEDYQMNMEVVFSEAPTSLAYSSNKRSVAMYPLCVEFLKEDGSLGKGGIIFLSEDKLHDHQQVEGFEIRAFQIFKEKLPYEILNWKRYSDGCGAQFWSRYVTANLFKMKEQLKLDHISYDRFEAHEGKSISDTLGSISKSCFNRALFKNEQGVSSLSEIVQLIKTELPEFSKKFDFLLVEEYGQTYRIQDRNELIIPNISTMHSLTLIDDDVLRKEQSCRDCRVSMCCDVCKNLTDITPKSKMKLGMDDACEADDRDNAQIFDDEDEGKTDESDTDNSSDDEEEIHSGDIVWGLLGRIWYPGRVTSLSDIPENLKKKFSTISGMFILNWYGDNMYSAVKRVEPLGETQLDAKRASRSKEMQKLYNMAISDL